MTVWMHQHLDLLPMQLSEGVVYQYLSWLRDTGAAPTFADATVKSIWFMRATAGMMPLEGGPLPLWSRDRWITTQ